MIQTLIAAAKVFHLPPLLLVALCSTESDLKSVINPQDGGSPSYGVCQLKLDTARQMGFSGTPTLLMNPETNTYYAAKYFKWQWVRTGGSVCDSVSAYNLGTAEFFNNGTYKNRSYVAKVLNRWRMYEQKKNKKIQASKNRREGYDGHKGFRSHNLRRNAWPCKHPLRFIHGFIPIHETPRR